MRHLQVVVSFLSIPCIPWVPRSSTRSNSLALPERLWRGRRKRVRMLQITPHMRVLFAVNPVDFRKGIDGIARLCLDILVIDTGWSSAGDQHLSISSRR